MTPYADPWRPLYEVRALALWLGVAACAWSTAERWGLNPASFRWLALAALGMALGWLPGAVRGIDRREWLRGRPVAFLAPEDLLRRMPGWRGQLWLGWSFDWQPRHAQEALDLLRAGVERFAPRDPARLGAAWIHGLGGADRDALIPLEHTEGHLLAVGTTGCGKTRLLDLLVAQAVLRGEAVVLIDLKGDRGLRQAAERACALAGDPGRFRFFHPAFPQRSVRINPLRNFQRASELASRVAALIPSETGNDPFKSFGQMALGHVVHGLLAVEERPTLALLRRYLEGGPEPLVARVLERYFERQVPRWEEHAQGYLARAGDPTRRTRALVRFYRERVRETRPSTVVDGLVGLYEHEAVHFGKMIASLMPVLVMLTSESLEGLLSPAEDDPDDPRPAISVAEVLKRREVLYVGLDSLSDAMVGGAIGSMLTADLAAVAGAIYNNDPRPAPANIVIDEAAEVVSDPMIQLLNKGRGAGLRLAVATQTFADFAARMGSQDKARQVLGNINALVAMRLVDAETQAYIAEGLPHIRLRTVVPSLAASAGSDRPLRYTGTAGERLDEAEAPLFPPALLGELPNFEYLARWPGGRVAKGRLPILGEPRADRADSPTPTDAPAPRRADPFGV